MIRKRFGQNFLTDRHALGRIADALALTGTETVLEVGPGKGALTDLLAPRCARLVGIEIDRDFVAALKARFSDQPHVSFVAADVRLKLLERDEEHTRWGAALPVNPVSARFRPPPQGPIGR